MTDDAFHVDLPSGYSATIRPLRRRDVLACRALLIQPAVGRDGERLVDPTAYEEEVILRGLVAWNLDDDDGMVWPIAREYVRQLEDGDAKALLAAIEGVTRISVDKRKEYSKRLWQIMRGFDDYQDAEPMPYLGDFALIEATGWSWEDLQAVPEPAIEMFNLLLSVRGAVQRSKG